MKTETKRFFIYNSIGTPSKGRPYISPIVELENTESASEEEVKKFFETQFHYIDPKFFEVFDFTIAPFKKVLLQSYQQKDDFAECLSFSPSVHYKGVKQDTFIAFIKKHEIYFEFTPSHMYCFCKKHFERFSSWGGRNSFLARGKDGLYWVSFSMEDGCGWPPTEEYYAITIKKVSGHDPQGYEWPFLLALPTLFAKNILVAKVTTYV